MDRAVIADTETLRTGIDKLLPRLWRFCLILTKNRTDADDLVQAACLRALERENQFQPDTRLDRWVFRIAHTIWLNQLRSEKVRTGTGVLSSEEAELVDSAAGPELNLYLRQVLSGVMELPEAQRITLLLVYVEGYSYKEAADQLDVPIGTVMSRLAGARERLATLNASVATQSMTKA
jgi:RNA polymerase sigma-70 factor (ECF subfamily)